MKTIKRTLAALALMLAATTTLSANCLSHFNNYMNVCEAYTSGFREVGCKMDAVVEYWDCVGNSATS